MALTLPEQAALAAGYPMPQGTDMISTGDDAIRAAGVTAHGREFVRPALTTAHALDALITPGYHPIPDANVAAAIGAPADFQAQGGVYVDVSGWSGASGPILRQTLWAYTRDHRLTRTRLSNGSWGLWNSGILRSDLGTSVASIMRLSRWLADSPAVYTSGKGAVAFTFDHGLTKFESAGLPGVLSGYGWGYALALNDSTLSSAENAGATDADILSWAGAEIWNHGLTHSATANPDTARSIVVDGKAALEARFGRTVFGYIPAGVGPTGLAGFDGGSSPEMFATTLAGQMIMEHHAVTTGYMGAGGVRQLNGAVQQGLGRFTMDAQTVARIKLQIDLAISDRVGVMFMLHPSLLDTTGYLTTAQLLEVLAYARTRQQSGDLAVLSPGELVRADAGLTPSDASSLPVRVSDLERDTGWRSIPHTGAGGAIHVRRVGDEITLRLVDFVPPAGQYAVNVAVLPAGFRYAAYGSFQAIHPSWSEAASIYGHYSGANIAWLRTINDTPSRPTLGQYAEHRFTTADPWPSTLPGTPA